MAVCQSLICSPSPCKKEIYFAKVLVKVAFFQKVLRTEANPSKLFNTINRQTQSKKFLIPLKDILRYGRNTSPNLIL